MPGYRNERTAAAPAHHVAEPDAGPVWPVASNWSTGKSPVRGFPPVPGQPPVRYPPGQFAAWNRPGEEDADSAVLLSDGDAGWPGGSATDWGQPWYPDGGPDAEAYGGYSELADGDAAATSTQAWPTLGGPREDNGWPAADTGPHAGSGPAGAAAGGRNGAAAPAVARTDDSQHRPGDRPAAGTAAGGRAGGSRAAKPGPVSAPSRRPAKKGDVKRKGRSSAILAVCAVLVLALAAVTFLVYVARHHSTPSAAHTTKPRASSSPSASPSPTLGRYGHIPTRQADPTPLTVAQLYPRTFTLAGHTYLRTASRHGRQCGPALVGTRLQAAVKAAKCSQVVRASYVSTGIHMMGTIGVLNLGTAKRAARAGQAAGAADFIAQVQGRRGPTKLLGHGTGIEEAVAKGHYLILMWSQFTGRHKPRTPAQRKRLEAFMTTMFQHTANISLTNRMVDGTPKA